MDLSKFSLSLNKKIIKYCQDIKHRLRNKEFGYIEVFPIHYIPYKYVVFVSFFVVVVLNPFLLNYRILINSVVFTIN
jgi:hypothetical protein